ncbi:MAG: hypothetical protein K5798_02485 [Nitrosopumilus sp.]|uniref:Intracellular proteinase inhibitor BsuPI domain-containing protein n=1 Tax=Nitrosopumilus zosterae TaxID=718286 RepID=A0A2S2KS48_9ARCH|nr:MULTISPECIES: hypothetical protein [Nitrosopumilus]MCV0366117.1 hypothetical protein [Nitrosopumilus sp.]BDQ30283.1 hypothetical protein NZOSNM25_000384 [Nitrosopumilus zosterae]GBH34278.1 hypothetical protein NZNM25_10690 [Nitrosopumilus zosterae]
MVSKKIFIVFVLPVIFSIVFGSAVMSDILQKPDRELHLLPMSTGGLSIQNSSIEIIGLSKQYSTSEPVEIQIKVRDSSFDCGDLYVTIYSSTNDVVTQGGYFEQCFEKGSNMIPTDDEFSKSIETPGSYEIVAEMVSKQLKSASARGSFTVK